MNDLVQRIYAAFDPSPLKADNGGLYVELDDVRGEADIVKRTSVKIRLAEGEPTCQVLAGHKGSGKSTELYRLQRELESRAILQYVNDDEWYGLNPMVAAVKNPVPPTEGAT